ncbi:MAG: hypothetical protein OXQ89_10345 [Rhodospirillaceae bacterium]|nr:hypothetical protein [Rhodospirillaceae bacterium]
MHELVTPVVSSNKLERNAGDLARFLSVVFGWSADLRAGKVAGPFALATSPKLYIGKVRTRSPFQ